MAGVRVYFRTIPRYLNSSNCSKPLPANVNGGLLLLTLKTKVLDFCELIFKPMAEQKACRMSNWRWSPSWEYENSAVARESWRMAMRGVAWLSCATELPRST